jgi:hypothetical protein
LSLSLCILQSLYIYFINRNRVLLYICDSFYISAISLLYCCLSCNISEYFCVISPLSFCAENNPDQWYQSRLLLIIFQCMSPTRSEYRKLGLELVSLEDNRSHTPKKPSMVEENKNDGADDPITLLLEQALT